MRGNVGSKRQLGIVLSMVMALVLSPVAARADSPAPEEAEEDAVEAAEAELDAPQYFEANLAGIRKYMAYLGENNLQKHDQLFPAYRRLQRKENEAILGSSFLGFGGTMLAISGVSFLSVRRTDASGSVHREANGSVVGIGLGMIAAAFLFYDLVSPSRADIVDFVNQHNVVNGARPIRYESGALFEF